MTGGVLDITAAGDGIDSESIVIISGGSVRIETTGVPVETSAITNTAPSTARKGMWEETADVEFEKSSKGINAEWMLYISGGEITVAAASHCIHCEDEIQIDGGIFTLSSTYEKGISAHGNLTVNGSETVMDITKSTEGMESKNVLTVNDGVITVAASDDALNATGEKSGDTMGMGGNIGIGQDKGNRVPPESAQGTLTDNPAQAPAPTQSQAPARSGKGENRQPGNMQQPSEAPEAGGFSPSAGARPQTGGNAAISGNASGNMQSNGMKDCLIINGGVLELYAGDDCLDANGNLLINGGTIKATNSKGSFSGATGVIDPDGQATISKEATLIFASGSGNERSFNLTQNTITVYCAKTHTANETITLTHSNGNTLYEYTPVGSFAAVFIASDALETGETYNITVGDEVFEAAITGQSTVIGTSSTGSGGFGRGQMMR